MSAYRYIVAVLIGLYPAVSYGAVPKQVDLESYRALIVQDLRLATAGYRLASANAAYCKTKERNPGWVIHDIAQYPDANTAAAAFGFTGGIQIAGLVQNGPADQAGVQTHDAFVSVDDKPLIWSGIPAGASRYARMAAFKKLLSAALAKKPSLPIKVLRGGKPINITLSPPLVCASDFQIDTLGGMDAGADGKMVSVTADLAEYADDDDALAIVVAHEMAHNILGHSAKLKAAGVKRGIGQQFGKSRDMVRATETEADRLAIWLAGNAGYDLDASIVFLQKLGGKIDGPFTINRTHLPWKDRGVMMRAEAALYKHASFEKNSAIQGRAVPPLLAN